MKMPPSFPAAFSLIEVVVALGLVSFCLVSMVGLLSAGLSTEKDTRERAAAASSAEKIAGAIREAADTAGTYQALGSYSNLFWTIGGSAVTGTLTNISLSGDPVTTSGPRLTARILLTPPATRFASGTALISVAWPSQAIWNPSSNNWMNAAGSISTWLIFNPR